MMNDFIYALYDAMITAECCGDFATASAYDNLINNKQES